ncbi:MAG: preprotein translocase subunit SecG [Chitinophagaceae bacterium]|nr:preprotein translocase subunit SecG [Chitinophagaceae bacterium]
MTILFLVLIVIAAVALGFMVLVQNPKGGGLSGNVGGINNQFMGVKQTTDVLEKGTWIFAGAIAVLALFSSVFLKSGKATAEDTILQKVNTNTSAPAPTQQAPAAGTTTTVDTTKK